MIKIRATTVGDKDTPGKRLRMELERHIQDMANEGWTLRAMTSRGGTVYLVFAMKVKG